MKRALTSSTRAAISRETEDAAWLMTLRSFALAISRSLWKRDTHLLIILNTHDTQEALYHGNREEGEMWSHWKSRGNIPAAYREEFAKVKLGQKKAFSLLQSVSWLATQLSLELIKASSLVHSQKVSQHACITHQILNLQLGSGEGNLERHNTNQWFSSVAYCR